MPLAKPVYLLNDFHLDVARGAFTEIEQIHKFGRNSAVSSTIVPVCDGGFYRTPTSASAVTIAVISDSANDTAAGTGAREVTVQYLDSTFTEQTGTIATNGTTESTETITGVVRIIRAWVSASGTYATQSAASHNGTLTLQVSGAGNVWATIPQIGATGFGVGQSLIGAYTVPKGKTAYLLTTLVSIQTSKVVTVYFFARENANETAAPYTALRIKNIHTGVEGLVEIKHETIESYPEYTDLGFLASATTSSDISVEFELYIVNNNAS